MKIKICLAVLCTMIFFNVTAQFLRDQFVGKIYALPKNNDVSGSPFLFEDWKIGQVALANGTRFDNIKLKYDAYQGKFFFNRNDTMYETNDNVVEVRIKDETHLNDSTYDMVFKNNLPTDNKLFAGAFLQVLCDGKIILFRRYVKKIEGENSTNGYSRTVSELVLRTSLWAIVNDHTIAANFTAHFLEELTKDKKTEVGNYVKANGLNIKTEKGFTATVAYYNLISK